MEKKLDSPTDNEIWNALRSVQYSSNPDDHIKAIRSLFTPLQSQLSESEKRIKELEEEIETLSKFDER